MQDSTKIEFRLDKSGPIVCLDRPPVSAKRAKLADG